jgi:hypothetical protein
MTDDELRQYLKPKHPPWLAIAGFVITLLGAAAALGKWVFTAPTKEDYSGLEMRTKTVEMDHAVLKANVDGMRNDLADVKNVTKDINTQLMQLRITGRGRHEQ